MPEIPNVQFSCGNSNISDLLQILATEIQTNFKNWPRRNVPKLCRKAKKTWPQNRLKNILGVKVSMWLKGLLSSSLDLIPTASCCFCLTHVGAAPSYHQGPNHCGNQRVREPGLNLLKPTSGKGVHSQAKTSGLSPRSNRSSVPGLIPICNSFKQQGASLPSRDAAPSSHLYSRVERSK
jgi:hypothetical protein